MAIKPRRATLEIFNLSFLDIISCAFGAVVILVLLSKNGQDSGGPDDAGITKVAEKLAILSALEQEQQGLRAQTQAQQQTRDELDLVYQFALDSKNQTAEQVKKAQAQADALARQNQDLEQVLASQKALALQKQGEADADEEVGGIPVDSEYIIIIVDTSGSMVSIWSKVVAQMQYILDSHPEVKGFQIMNDMGNYLLSGYAGRWIKDSPRVRNTVLAAVRNWGSYSNSSPVEGLSVALRTYAKADRKLAIYILGDDYTGGSYDPVINTLNKLNTNRVTGERIARVHAIGFVSNASTNRFSVLMREVTRQNRGTFLALP